MNHRSRAKLVSSVVIILIVALVAAIHYGSTKPKQNTTEIIPSIPVASTTSSLVLEDKKTINEDKKAGYKITAIYPVLTAGLSEDAKIKINHAISDQISAVINDFKKGAIDSLPTTSKEESTLDISYETTSAQSLKDILSFRLIETSYDAGAAHPSNVIETMNFNILTGESITLGTVFGPYPDTYLPRLSDFTFTALNKKLGNDKGAIDNIKSGTTPNEENFSSFVFTDSGILFIFQAYQVAPYAAGSQEVLVPYSAIRDIIKKGTFLDSVIK